MNLNKKLFTIDELPIIANLLIEQIQGMNTTNATIVTLVGDLGAGKTTLTQALAVVLGVKENIISPTFVIMKKYETKKGKWKNLIHIDAYRLENSQQLLNLGWEEIIKDKNNIILLEWPELVPDCIPSKEVCRVILSHIDEKTRMVEILL